MTYRYYPTDLTKIAPWTLEVYSVKRLEYLVSVNNYAIFPLPSPAIYDAIGRHHNHQNKAYKRDLINSILWIRESGVIGKL